MPVTLDFTRTLNAFASPLPLIVQDTVGYFRRGVWETSEPVAREKPIKAIVLHLNLQQLDILTEGSASAGGIAVLTQDLLYFTDPKYEGVSNQQSYVVYQGLRYRVVGEGLTSGPGLLGNANFNVYHCLRIIE